MIKKIKYWWHKRTHMHIICPGGYIMKIRKKDYWFPATIFMGSFEYGEELIREQIDNSIKAYNFE